MPASQAEIAAATLAAQKIADAQREAEKQLARVEIAKLLSDSRIPALSLFITAELSRVTEKNLPFIVNELLALPKEQRESFLIIQKSSKKYVILDAICAGGKFKEFTASDLNAVGIIPQVLGYILGPNKPDAEKNSPYECGFEAFEDARMKFDVRYYLVAILFILFDLEIAFLFPWAIALKEVGLAGFVAVVIFLAILVVGFVYEWKKGSLDWE
jgi:NADH-quinone oxidoreductase subunit A